MPKTNFIQFGDTRVNLDVVICYTPCKVQHFTPPPDGSEPDAATLRSELSGIRFETNTGPVAVKFRREADRDAALKALDTATAPEILFESDDPERAISVSNSATPDDRAENG